MRTSFILFFFLLFCSEGYGQTGASRLPLEEIKRRRTQIAATENDTQKVFLYLKMVILHKNDSAQVDAYVDTIGTFHDRLNSPLWKGYHQEAQGMRLKHLKDDKGAISLYQQALSVYEQGDHYASISRVANMLSRHYSQRRDYVTAFDYAARAYEAAVPGRQPSEQARALRTMGQSQLSIKDYDTALGYFRRALKVNRQSGINTAASFIDIAHYYNQIRQPDSSIYYNERALEELDKKEDRDLYRESIVNGNLSSAYTLKKDYARASGYARTAYDISVARKDERIIASQAFNLAENLNLLGDHDGALLFLREAQTLGKRLEYNELLRYVYHRMAEVQLSLKKEDSTRYYMRKLFTITDVLVKERQVKTVSQLEAKYQNKQKQAEIDRLALEDQVKSLQLKRQSWLIGGGLLLLGLLGSFLYFLLGQRRQIRAQNDTITAALAEKNTLLKEIHHRVKNNLQMVSSLLSLQSDYIEDARAQDAIRMGQSRVRSMAIIHQKLYMRDQVSTAVSAKEYLDQLIAELMQTLNITGVPLRMTKRIEEINLDIDRLIPLGLVANEVITNAMKYAFTGRDSGQLDIDFRRSGPDVELIIADDGPGLSQELADDSNSFGNLLIRTFAEQLEGEIVVDGTAGTRVVLRFPFE